MDSISLIEFLKKGGSRFLSVLKGGKIDASEEGKIFYQLKRADRKYTDSTGEEGVYLDDFLAKHGDEIARPINADLGDPHCKGKGIVFI